LVCAVMLIILLKNGLCFFLDSLSKLAYAFNF
jgi:hypothetical protein